MSILKSKITLDKVMQARNDLGKVQERALNTPDPADKLILLKMGYMSAQDSVPDHTKHTQKWIIKNALKYSDKLINSRNRNLAMMNLYPKNTKGYLKRQRNDQIYLYRIDDMIKYIQNSLRNGETYIDDYVILDVDNDYKVVYPDYLAFDDYLKPYRQYLQTMYLKMQNKNTDLTKYKRN